MTGIAIGVLQRGNRNIAYEVTGTHIPGHAFDRLVLRETAPSKHLIDQIGIEALDNH